MKRKNLIFRIFILAAFTFIFTQSASAELETPLLTDVSASSGSVPYLQTNWYGSTAIAGKGYCAILSPSSGNSDLYLLDSSFNLVSSSKNTGLTADKIWYGQTVAGAFHVAGFGAANPSSNYAIQIITSPCVKSLSPLSALPGALVTLTGFGFGDTKGTSYVKFGAVTATSYLSWTNTQIKVYLPSGVTAGVNQIVAYVNAKASNPSNFTVIGGASSEGTMWRYGLARTGNYPNGPAAMPTNLKWTYSGVGIGHSPVIANNIVYIPAQYNLVAIDANNGIRKWIIKGTNFFDEPAIANGIVYAGCGTTIYALDANTGVQKWSNSSLSTGIYGSVAVANGIVYAGGKDYSNTAQSKIYALDANTGALKWSYIMGQPLLGSPTVANNLVFITPEGNKIHALDANTGVLKWIYATDATRFSTPTVVNNVLYVVGAQLTLSSPAMFKMKVFALDASTGTLKWNYSDEVSVSALSPTMCSSPAISGNTLYFGALNTEAYALDITTRTLKWSFKSGALGNDLARSSPIFSNNLLYVGSAGGTFYTLDANIGSVKGYYLLGTSYVYSSPAIADKKVYIANEGKLYCYGE